MKGENSHTGRRTTKRLRDAAQIDNYRLDTISFAFDLGHKPLHLVAVEGIGDILTSLAISQQSIPDPLPDEC